MSSEKPETKPADKRPAKPERKGLRALKLPKRRAPADDTSTAASRREARKANAAKAAAAKAQAARSAEAAKSAKAPKTSRPSDDARKHASPVAAAATEAVKLGREMLAIPAQAFMAVAELAGAGVLWIWRRLVWPAALAIVAFLGALVHLGQRHVTPARGVIVVAIVAVGALAASQWLDYRGVSVGSDAYTDSVAAIAPAPDIETERAGEAHAWVMVPLALAALLVVVIAARGRPGAARLLIGIGIAAIAISLLVDMPKGLDEGEATVAYQGAEARLLDGFWMQIVTAAVLIACGALLPSYLRSTPASARRQAEAPRGKGRLRKLTGGARKAARRATPDKRKVQGAGT